ncbi:chaperonin family protein RbcX [Spirulina sp. CS-785/01]|uniref:RuBisCO chaperone RbcX n=1 Tax=Spirulina sp. CS-785/01 TaxID=3021716 RepID=UPI00232C5C2F|nr:chaperonin family protein RbcX [Spirulina sp. CS-785/01]MDB9313616.1 chaperonin family protein RbcX [Spirulina sp. CS-785/01]
MDAKQIARETARTLQSYLTYQAVRVIIEQLSETNPPQSIWLSNYSAGKLNDGEAYLENLMLEHKDLVVRILTVREDIAEQVLDFVPEMVRSNIQQSNIAHRRQLLERLTRLQPTDSDPPSSDQRSGELQDDSPSQQDSSHSSE